MPKKSMRSFVGYWCEPTPTTPYSVNLTSLRNKNSEKQQTDVIYLQFCLTYPQPTQIHPIFTPKSAP